MKSLSEFINEAKSFDKKEFDKMVDEAVTEMWKSFNKLETIENYLRITGQGGAKSAWKKKIKVIEDALNKFD